MRSVLSTSHQTLKGFGTRHRTIIFCVALILFFVGLSVAIKSLNIRGDNFVWTPLLCAIFLTQPLLIFLNSLELKLCGQAVGVDIKIRDSIYVSSSATLANILPLPAGLIVRGGALMQRGASLSFVGKVLLVAGIMWMAVALTVSGVVISGGVASALIGFGGFGSIIVLMVYISRISRLRIAFGFLVIRCLMVAMLTLQLKLCFSALGEVVTLRGSAVYVVSGIAGAVVSIVPAGLGLTESFGAFLAKLDGASAALAYVVLSLNRLIGLCMAGVSFILFSQGRSQFTPITKN